MARWVRTAAGAALVASLGIAWSVALDMRAQVGRSVPGFVLFVNGAVGPHFLAPGGGAAAARGLRVSDRIVAIDGHPVVGGPDVFATVAAVRPGARLALVAERPSGQRFDLFDEARIFSEADYRRLVLPLLLGGLLLLAVGAVPILVRPELATARIFFVFCIAGVTNYCFLAYDYFYTYRFVPFGYAAEALATGSILHLGLAFPMRRWPLTRHPRPTLTAIYSAPVLLAALYVHALYRAPRLMAPLDYAALPLYMSGFLLLTLNAASAAFRAPTPMERQRARVVVIGPALVLLTGAALIAMTMSGWDLGIPTFVYVLLGWTLPVALAYGLLRHNVFELNSVVRRGLSFGLVLLALALGYVGSFVAIQRVAGIGTAWASAALAVVLLGAAIPLVAPLRRGIEGLVESTFFPGYRNAVTAVHDAGRSLARLRDPGEVADCLRAALDASVGPRCAYIIFGFEDEPLRELDPASGSAPLVTSPNDPLVDLLRRGGSVRLPPAGGSETLVASDLRRHLERLEIELIVPFPQGQGCVGGFLLGAREDGRLYTSDDETLLETLAAHSVAAIENAHSFEELRRLQRQLARENVSLRCEVDRSAGFEEIIGEAPGLKSVLAQVEQVASTDAVVLVVGETGTGKELVVRALHRRSLRREGPFVELACAAMPESLIESELFGHERGAYTGATAMGIGRFQAADGGTLFLDDVDTLPLAVQAKLLRAIQEGEIQRLGRPLPLHVDVRIVAATNKDLAAEVEAGRFREDLFYRLNVVPIRIPPLRERRDDVALLAEHFLALESERLGRAVHSIEEETLAQLRSHSWPGNVRELRNAVQRGIVMSSDGVFRLSEPFEFAGGARLDPAPGRPLAEQLRAYKIDVITRALERHQGHQRKAAAELGLHPPSLSRMLRELGIRVRRGDDGG